MGGIVKTSAKLSVCSSIDDGVLSAVDNRAELVPGGSIRSLLVAVPRVELGT